MKVDITLYQWWLAAWSDNGVRCSFLSNTIGCRMKMTSFPACGQSL
jgi:hypothetical protein